MMHIGFDAKRLFNNFTGLGNYSRTLVSNLAIYYPDDLYYLFTPGISQSKRTKPFLDTLRYQVIRPPARRPLWRTRGMVASEAFGKLDLFHGLSHELPVGITSTGVASVVTMHDLIFKYFPGDYNWFDRVGYELKFRSACARADCVIAISEQTKRDLIQYYSVPEERIEVVYQSCDPSFAILQEEGLIDGVRDKYNLPGDYLLYVGSVIRRKNLGSLLRALEILPRDLDIPLVVIGSGKTYLRELRAWLDARGMTGRVKFMEDIPFEDFPAIYQGCRAFVFPSIHEGFGIPVIEALHSRVPVITSNQSALPEAGGDLALYIDPADPESIADMISRVLTRPEEVERPESAYQEHLAQFDPEVVSTRLHRLYESLLS